MDDLTLLQLFVSGDVHLEANRNLRVEPVNCQRQLFSRDGALLATAHDQAFPPCILLRGGTKYTSVLHQTLIDHHLIPVTGLLADGCTRYEYHPVPKDCLIHCDPARNLWKRWWQDQKRFTKQSNDATLQILVNGQWQAIDNIVLNRSTLYITAANHETICHGDDNIVWLEQEELEATVLVLPELASVSNPLPAPPPRGNLEPETEHQTVPNHKTLFYRLDNPEVKVQEDKIYIQTPFGEVVLMGESIKRLTQVSPGYDREKTAQPFVKVMSRHPR